MTAPETGWCGWTGPRGGGCGQPITRGILNPGRWHHNLRMLDFAASRAPEKHEPVPLTDLAEIATARAKWLTP